MLEKNYGLIHNVPFSSVWFPYGKSKELDCYIKTSHKFILWIWARSSTNQILTWLFIKHRYQCFLWELNSLSKYSYMHIHTRHYYYCSYSRLMATFIKDFNNIFFFNYLGISKPWLLIKLWFFQLPFADIRSSTSIFFSFFI